MVLVRGLGHVADRRPIGKCAIVRGERGRRVVGLVPIDVGLERGGEQAKGSWRRESGYVPIEEGSLQSVPGHFLDCSVKWCQQGEAGPRREERI